MIAQKNRVKICILFWLMYIAVTIESRLLTSQQGFPRFSQYVSEYGKKYENAQYVSRQATYMKNLQHIQKSNCSACGVNMFTDWSSQQMKKLKGGYETNIPRGDVVKEPFSLRMSGISLQDKTPLSYDWRQFNAVTPVRDQSSCGSCWAFSTTAFFQSDLIINEKLTNSLDLSEQFLLKCDNRSLGCDGGFLFWAMQKVIQYGGVPTESQYTYSFNTFKQGMCQQSQLVKFSQDRKLMSYYEVQDQTFIQKLILKKPVNVNLCSTDMQFYAPTSTSRTLQCSPNYSSRDHTVLLIGYTETQWIIKNQWSKKWGVQGYAYISRNKDNDCCIGKQLFTTGTLTQQNKCQVGNCEICVQQTSCFKCKPGYYVTNVNRTHYCSPCSALFCAECINYFGLCNICQDGYSVAYPNYKCQKWTVQHCSFMYKGFCSECHSGYMLNKDFECVVKTFPCQIKNCTICQSSNTSQCKTCSNGYTLDSLSKKCQKVIVCNIQNCIKCNFIDSSICQTCKDNYYFSSSQKKCLPVCNVNFCQVCQSTLTSICQKCLSGYLLTETKKKCYNCNQTYCSSCSQTTAQCQTCLVGYYLNLTTFACLTCSQIQNCVQCSQLPKEQLTCTICANGYTLSKDKTKCLKCLSGCSTCTYDNLSSCIIYQVCTIGSYYDSGLKACKPCKSGCLQCNTLETCTKCLDSYALANGSCSQKCQQSQKCDICSSKDTSICQNCAQGYIVSSSGKCLVDDQNYCLQQNANTTVSCTSCPQKYYLKLYKNKKVCAKCQTTDSNCISCESSSPQQCSKCEKKYYLVKSASTCKLCSSFDSNCLDCISQDYCTECKQGYFILSSNLTDQNSGICNICDSSCKTCKFTAQSCYSCYKGYQLSIDRRCLRQIKVKFLINLDADFNEFLNQVLTKIYEQLAKILSLNSTKYIEIYNVTKGSILLFGSVHMPQNQSNGTQFLSKMKNSLSSQSSIASYSLLSTQLNLIQPSSENQKINNTDVKTQDPRQQSKLPTPAIIGISVGAGVFAIIILIIIVFFLKKYTCDDMQQAKNKKAKQSKQRKRKSSSSSADNTKQVVREKESTDKCFIDKYAAGYDATTENNHVISI